jgi:hypothetical protein
MGTIIFSFLSVVFFFIFFKILSYFSFSISPMSNIIQLFIIIIVIIPLSLVCSKKLIELIKRND